MRRIRHTLVLVTLGLFLLSCGGAGSGGSDGQSGIRILLTDAPGQFTHAWVNIVEVAIHQPGGPWQTLSLTGTDRDTNGDGEDDIVVEGDGSLTVDLIALKGTSALIASASMPDGKYTQIRMIVSGDGTVELATGEILPLKVPSGARTGVKIGGSFEIPPGAFADVLLDFDAEKSIHVAGKSGKAILRPVILPKDRTPAVLRWEEIFPAGTPSPRERFDMAYDGARGVVVLYGGTSGATDYAETWEYDPAVDVWTLVDPASPPGERRLHRMTYDSDRQKTVLFGGYIGGMGLLNDTWEYDAGTWTQLFPTGSIPSPRFGHDMVYDEAAQVVVLFGKNGATDPDTYEFDGAIQVWSQLAVPGPSPRAAHAMDYDSVSGRVLLFGGMDSAGEQDDLWAYSGGAWTLLGAAGPSPRRKHAVSFDASRNVLVLFGGQGPTDVLGDTWEWDGSGWDETGSSSPTSPAPRHSVDTVVYDANLNRTFLFGGKNGGGAVYGDVWVYGYFPIP